MVIAGRLPPDSPEPAQPWRGGGPSPSEETRSSEPAGILGPALLDFFPRRSPPWGVIVTAAAVTGLLLAAYRGLGAPQPLWVGRPIPAFGLEGPGNLASCVSTLVLTAAAIGSLLIWSLLQDTGSRRRHIWLLAAGWWFFMGLDESSGLHLAIGPLLQEVFSARDPASPWWWAVPYVFIFCAILSRLIFDLRYSGWSTFWMTLAVGMYGASGLIQTGLISTKPLGGDAVLWEELGEQVGHWCLLLSTMSFGQFLLRSLRAEFEPEIFQDTPPELQLPHPGAVGGALSEGPGVRPAQFDNQVPGDYLIIHPPHGQGPPVTVPRVVQRVPRRRRSASQTSASSARRRSDLDLPAGYRSVLRNPPGSPGPSVAPGGNTPEASARVSQEQTAAVPPQQTGPVVSGAANAFLAGMAYAEARQAEPARQATATVSARESPPPISVSRPVQAPTGSSAQSQPAPSQVGGANFSGPQAATSPTPSLPQLPSRRLTKEEKKRLKQLYKQRMAELEAAG